MTSEELLQQLKNIQNIKCETQTLELKSAEKGCPTRFNIRKEISEFLKIKSVAYAMKRYVQPLIESGKIKLTIPDTPKSTQQKYYS
ncbi:Fic family protein [Phascolarctobacterium sp.]|uniref:Fic family protein n=1 Tax=Phascolarctobacterium sp. TaxID=2049039 RepID=UPI003F81B747